MSDSRILRGAASGVIAAAAWAAQQPLDKLIFSSRYDDVELLGRAVVADDHYYAPGLSLHLINGGLFGAIYSLVAPTLPGPPWAKAPAMALIENTALWPLVTVIDRHHPARDKLPTLAHNRPAFWQSTWRHLLFGVVLGELERRLGPPAGSDGAAVIETVYSSNGHGDIAHATVPITQAEMPPGESQN